MKFWFICAALICAAGVRAQTPQWIWHSQSPSQTVYFRKAFRTPPLTWNSRLTFSADDQAEVYLNGVLVARCTDWRNPSRSEVSVRLNQGENVIAARAENREGTAGLLIQLNVGGETNVVTDETWLVSTVDSPDWNRLGAPAANWENAKMIGEYGIEPWGNILNRSSATPAEAIQVTPGFRVELLRSAEPDEGSWICMTFDHKGRLIISPQGDEKPLLRLTLAEGKVARVEPLNTSIHYAMGLLDAFDSLYANAHGPYGAGLYRLKDTNDNDRFEPEEIRLLKRFEGGSEHGYHALALGPDRQIYVLNGNGTKLPDGLSTNSPYRNYAEDALTGSAGREEDQDGSRVPNGHVLRTDAEGRRWQLWAGGMRNAYDMDFNEAGELFTFDSDMEWDWGTAWYRPTRILHLVSGGEYGWRDGTRMWADEYPDALPTAAYIGIGSPTGVKFGSRSNFPERYRRALFAMDWSYGRILAVHLAPLGSSYTGKSETFLQGTPLNLTSLTFGPDGAMYFITGGRGTQSGLYRVSCTAPSAVIEKDSTDEGSPLRRTRRLMEALHSALNIDALNLIQQVIRSADDPHILFAARVALERQPVNAWREQALAGEGSERARATMLLALARVEPQSAVRIVEALQSFPTLDVTKLRIIEVLLARNDQISPALRESIVTNLNGAYPAGAWPVNRELSRILLRLAAPGAVHKTIQLLQRAPTQEQQTHYVELLRNIREGWSLEDRRAVLSWFLMPRGPAAHPPEIQKFFRDVSRTYVDGAYFDKYLREFRRQTIGTLTPDERRALASSIGAPIPGAQRLPAHERTFVRAWRMEELLPALESRKPDLARGRQAFVDAQCITCHRVGNDGGSAGPELSAIGSKYSARDILESILEPSRVLSDQYQNYNAVLKDGEVLTGRLLGNSGGEIVLETDRVAGTTEKIPTSKIQELTPSRVSPMPEGLASVLSKEEILDLVAWLRSSLH